MTCTDNEDCTIDCAYYPGNYDEGCQEAVLNCPDNAKCTVLCDNREGCDRARINARTSTELQVTCSNYLESCWDTNIYCPDTTNPTSPTCIISGDNSGSDVFDGMQIYAQNGLNDISITSTNTLATNIVINCGSSYGDSCNVERTSPWQNCNGGDATCDYVTPIPTDNPTESPSSPPSLSPTLMPSISPSSVTISPSNAPTLNPSLAPSIATATPTISPSNSPTIVPSMSPTNAPSISPTSNPTESPSRYPSALPTGSPTKRPTLPGSIIEVTSSPTAAPTETPTQDSGLVSDGEQKSDTKLITIHDNLWILIVIILAFLLCCVLGILGIICAYNHGTRRELKYIKEQMTSIELKDTNNTMRSDTMDGIVASSPVSINSTIIKREHKDTLGLNDAESNDQKELQQVQSNNRFMSKSMAIQRVPPPPPAMNYRAHQSVWMVNPNHMNMNMGEGNNMNKRILRVNSASTAYENDLMMNSLNTNGVGDGDGDDTTGTDNDDIDPMFIQQVETPMDDMDHITPGNLPNLPQSERNLRE